MQNDDKYSPFFRDLWPQIYEREGLLKVDDLFLNFLKDSSQELYGVYLTAREEGFLKDEDLLKLAPYLEDFLSHFFSIEKEIFALQKQHFKLAVLYTCKRLFVQRRALRTYTKETAKHLNGVDLRSQLIQAFKAPFSPLIPSLRLNRSTKEERSVYEYSSDELTQSCLKMGFCITFAEHVLKWLQEEETYQEILKVAEAYAAWAFYTEEGERFHQEDLLFKAPKKGSYYSFFTFEEENHDPLLVKKSASIKERSGFSLTDKGLREEEAYDQASYCIHCHKQGKDSCSKGLFEKETQTLQKDIYGKDLEGCPLGQKISEMNFMRSQGYVLGALAIAMIDNPLLAATGHRICNDCMKSCIYQKQEPVNIPGIETETLKEVLNLPWGFEIYSLLSRWNPLNIKFPLPHPQTSYKVLVVGMGPAGFTLSHYLLNSGHTVVAVEGLKIEPLPLEISGRTPFGKQGPFKPLQSLSEIYEDLDDRVVGGFGGVAEYGITVRWDKNYLKIIRLLLERRQNFELFGGVRFGSTLTYEKAVELGFDHIALCMGAGKPTLIPLKNNFVKGVRQASDFLMTLQLGGAFKKESLTNLEVALPIVVIGGGLTAIDTATEALNYYERLVEKFLNQYETLSTRYGEAFFKEVWQGEELEKAQTYLKHGHLLREERLKALQENRAPKIKKLLQEWGGATILYRRPLEEAPSFKLNPEEVQKALEEGIYFAENIVPLEVLHTSAGYATGLKVLDISCNEEKSIPAKTILTAGGTYPNTTLIEEGVPLEKDGLFFKSYPLEKEGRGTSPSAKEISFLGTPPDIKTPITFFGDLHPNFAGSVVNAMASAKKGYPLINQLLKKRAPFKSNETLFIQRLSNLLRPQVFAIKQLAPTIVEVILKAPLAVENFQPGQFYKLQNFETLSNSPMEGIALTGAEVDKGQGLLSLIVLEMGSSSALCASLKPGDPVLLMGPTGTPTEIPRGETVLLIGGGLGNAVLFSIGKALRQNGCRVLYVAGYRREEDLFKPEKIEEAADSILWCFEKKTSFKPRRPQDFQIQGTVLDGLLSYVKFKNAPFPLSEVDRLLVIGSDRLMAAVKEARTTCLKPYLNPTHSAIGSINSPMQCMMKEICGQCLQRHINPLTGEETFVFSCKNQDQLLDAVDFKNLRARLEQNNVTEKLSYLWLKESCRKKP